jgi:hypothetical protein
MDQTYRLSLGQWFCVGIPFSDHRVKSRLIFFKHFFEFLLRIWDIFGIPVIFFEVAYLVSRMKN